MANGLKYLKDYYPKASSATGRAEDQFFWLYSKHKTVPPAIFYLLVINRFLKPNRISPYLSRRIYPVCLHVRTHTRTSPPTVDVMTSKQRVFSQTGFPRNTISSKCTAIGEFQWFRKNETKKFEAIDKFFNLDGRMPNTLLFAILEFLCSKWFKDCNSINKWAWGCFIGDKRTESQKMAHNEW